VVPVGASVERAALLSQHGLTQEAKRDLIDVISGTDAKGKPEAYYQLGTLAFREGSVSVALETWRTLSEKFPGSPQATLVKDRLGQLAEVAQEVSRSGADNAVAQSYLSHADFWSERRGEKYRIDTSWLPVVEMAVAWYDRVIKEFPKTTASRLAHERKVRTLLGWAEPGSYGSAYGAHGNMATYMPQVEAAFAAFEVEAPDASATLQALRFQIAQRYWSSKKWPEARSWLNAMVQKAGEQESFYKDLAQRRLAKLEF
jgi:predicted Zn-dependent protease